jgi:hypothetical protein
VGFTKVFTVAGAKVNLQPLTAPATGTATCPAGSYAVGGSYEIRAPLQSRYFAHVKSGLDNANGWSITGYTVNSVTDIDVFPTVTCIQ